MKAAKCTCHLPLCYLHLVAAASMVITRNKCTLPTTCVCTHAYCTGMPKGSANIWIRSSAFSYQRVFFLNRCTKHGCRCTCLVNCVYTHTHSTGDCTLQPFHDHSLISYQCSLECLCSSGYCSTVAKSNCMAASHNIKCGNFNSSATLIFILWETAMLCRYAFTYTAHQVSDLLPYKIV